MTPTNAATAARALTALLLRDTLRRYGNRGVGFLVAFAPIYRAYINFGADYKTDFTVTVGPDDLKLFRQARFDVKKLAGKHVRVRGWVEQFNGPEMEISTPAAIQVLDEPMPEIAEKTAKVEKPAKVRVVAEKKKRVRTKKTASADKPAKEQATTEKKKRTRKKKTET